MDRTEYLTTDEYNELVGTECTILEIQEASEILQYHMNSNIEYDVLTAPDNLKLATAYQLEYMRTGIDEEYAGQSQSIVIGKYSESSNSSTSESVKICPKAQRYLVMGGLIRRII